MHRRFRFPIPLAMVASLLLPAGAVAAAEPLARLPLRPIGEGGLVLAEVTVGGGVHPFLVDTGGGLTILTPQLTGPAGCETFGRVTVMRSDGTRLDLLRCAPARLLIAGGERTLEAAVLDLGALGLPGIGGLLSLATFEGAAVTLDLAGRELTLESDASLAERVRGVAELTVRASRSGGGAALDLFVRARAARGDLWLELDSGNAGPLLLAPHAVAQLGIELAAADTAGAGTPVSIDLVGLGPTPLRAVAAERIYDGLVNAEFFLHHVVTFDLRTSAPRVWAAPRASP
jgi:hypothetical protein